MGTDQADPGCAGPHHGLPAGTAIRAVPEDPECLPWCIDRPGFSRADRAQLKC
ncbi:MAG: rubredoxin [Chloroflexi bacterium]|nr:MAG: rubredoxin [Chloroflexota bacterium]TMF50772.1 MAG: rubredoxin [Chloroflexota bacterium]TMG42903.1 MAG: rubredoxin [Chloroflexota bacterium]